jgi:hypothetical protein
MEALRKLGEHLAAGISAVMLLRHGELPEDQKGVRPSDHRLVGGDQSRSLA